MLPTYHLLQEPETTIEKKQLLERVSVPKTHSKTTCKTQMLNVWPIYLHLGIVLRVNVGKYHTLSIWERDWSIRASN